MPTFRYRAYGGRGELAEGVIDAASPEAASDLLWGQGLTPFQMRQADAAGQKWWQREVFAARAPSQGDLASFTRDFATLNTAEIPLDDALRTLAEQAAAAKMRSLAKALLADVLNGATLSDAMYRQRAVFPADYVSAVRAGEVGGTLAQVFEELADLLERRAEVRARINSALVYPAVLIMLAVASLGVVVVVLVPSIAPIFIEAGKPMPAVIEWAIGAEAHATEILLAAALAAAAAVGAAATVLRRPDLRLALDRRVLKLPGLGPFVLQQETARFVRTLGTLVRAGVPLLQASTSARAVVGNRHIATAMDGAIDMVREGASLHQALQAAAVLPSIALRMISVGEEAGKLAAMLLRVAAMFETQTQRSVERFMTVLSPLLTIVIAVLVGGLIITVMNAILGINGLVGR
jgi:general secretion pathway protein F